MSELPDDYYEPAVCKTPLPKPSCEELLSASQAREAALREKLEATELELMAEQTVAEAMTKRAEAAEARIKASQEQEPVAIVKGGVINWKWCKQFDRGQLFAQPPIPPELAELQREIETLQSALDAKVTICGDEQIGALKRENAELKAWKESAVAVMPDYQAIGKLLGVKLGDSVHDKILPAIEELTRKLAEIQRTLDEKDRLYNHTLNECDLLRSDIQTFKVAAWEGRIEIEDFNKDADTQMTATRIANAISEAAELRKLLEESKVPEGWLPIDSAPKDGTEVVVGYDAHGAWMQSVSYWRTDVECWRGGIEPTHWTPLPPQPKEPKQ